MLPLERIQNKLDGLGIFFGFPPHPPLRPGVSVLLRVTPLCTLPSLFYFRRGKTSERKQTKYFTFRSFYSIAALFFSFV